MKLSFRFCGINSNFELTRSGVYCLYFFIRYFNSVHETMSDHASNAGTFDFPLNIEDYLQNMGHTTAICIPPNKRNGVFHITSMMLHMLQMKGHFGDLTRPETQAMLYGHSKPTTFPLQYFSKITPNYDLVDTIKLCIISFPAFPIQYVHQIPSFYAYA